VHGNYRPSAGVEIDARPIPGSQRLVATVGPHHGWSFGALVIVNPDVRDDDNLAPLKRLVADVGFPEDEQSRDPIRSYGQAWPLSEDYYLCVYRCERDRSYGLYLLDAFGNRELIWRDKELHSLSPMPVKAMPVPPVVLELPRTGQASPSEATVAVVDVYDSLRPWPQDDKIAALRIMQLFPMPYSTSRVQGSLYPGPRIQEGGDSVPLTRASLGTVPVEPDGSAHFVVPAGKPLFFQALDAKGLAITSMRSETHFLPGERATCRGCHEPKHTAPPSRGEPARLAMRRPPSRLKPEVNENAPISFPRLVQPVLDKHCVACHAKNADKAPGLGRSLMTNKHGLTFGAKYFESYVNLLPYATYGYEGDSKRTIPGKFGARASKLYGLLSKGHHDVKLSTDEMRRLTLWLDSMSQFYGVYDAEGQQAELRGEYAKPPLE
jgi:cytochrome c553